MRVILTLLILCATGAAHAQAPGPYPGRPVKLVVGFAPGGAADFVARALQEPLSRALGQPVVVENRPGAGSSIAAEFVAKSPADGYTIAIASPSSILVNPIISPRPGFEPVLFHARRKAGYFPPDRRGIPGVDRSRRFRSRQVARTQGAHPGIRRIPR